MLKSNVTLNRLTCLFCFATLLFAGCDNGTEKPAKKAVVRQKIMISPQKGAAGAQKATSPQKLASKRDAAPPSRDNRMAKIKPYSPAGKTDPFVPLFRKTDTAGEQPATLSKKKRRKHVPRTPLERVDLSQLRLTGIIRSPHGNKALVEEATGKGYVVTVGTYLGNQGGKITEILDDRIIVEEEIETPLGELKKVPRQLKLQKSSGE